MYLSIKIKEDTTMKKDLNIVMNGETLVLDPKLCVEQEEHKHGEIHSGFYELLGTLPKPEFSDKQITFLP